MLEKEAAGLFNTLKTILTSERDLLKTYRNYENKQLAQNRFNSAHAVPRRTDSFYGPQIFEDRDNLFSKMHPMAKAVDNNLKEMGIKPYLRKQVETNY